jgi:anti-sigma B factor antagonist
MQIEISEAGSAATIKLAGRLDISGAEVIALPLATVSGNKNTVIIEMDMVTFIASIGLRHLTSAAKAVGRRGGRVILRNPRTAVTDVITTSGLADFFVIEVEREP